MSKEMSWSEMVLREKIAKEIESILIIDSETNAVGMQIMAAKIARDVKQEKSMIDWLVHRLFWWAPLRNAIFNEVHFYDEIDKSIKEYEEVLSLAMYQYVYVVYGCTILCIMYTTS